MRDVQTRPRRWRERGQQVGHTMPRMVATMRAEMSGETDDSPEAMATLAEHCYFSAAIQSKHWNPKSDGLNRDHFAILGGVFKLFEQYSKHDGAVPTVDIVQRSFPMFEYYSDSNPAWASEILRREADARRMKSTIREAAELISDRKVAEAKTVLRSSIEETRATEVVGSFLEDIEEADESLKIPPLYDAIAQCGGIPVNSFTIVLARLGIGKTWRLVQHGVAAALGGFPVVHFAMEERDYMVAKRVIKMLVPGVGDLVMPEQRLRAGRRIREAGGSFRIVDLTAGPVTTEAIARSTMPGSVVVLDYMGLMKSEDGRRMSEDWSVASGVSNSIRTLTVEHDITVIAGVQANRNTGKGVPDDTNIALADAIGQDIDLGIALHRPSRDCPVTRNKVFKARHGSTVHGQWYSRFDGDTADFQPLSYEEGLASIREWEIDRQIGGFND